MWTFILGKLDGTAIGEIQNATGRELRIGLNRAATATVTVRTDNPLAITLFAEDTLLKIYQDSTLRFHGFVVSCEMSSDGSESPTIAITAADPAWKISKRLVGLSKTGTSYTGDRAKSARKIINELNTNNLAFTRNPHTGIELLPEASYVAASGNYIGGPSRPALICINDLAHTLNGFDWYISPQDGSKTIKTENFTKTEAWTTPLLGTFEANNAFGKKANAVFEFGVGQKNVRSINYIRDLADTVNRTFHLPNDMETEAVVEREHAESINLRGRYEVLSDAFGLTDIGLREAWANEVIRVKHNPRYVVTMTLGTDDGTGRIPALGTDYWIGDTVTARGFIQGAELFSGSVRVYGVNISIAESGTATIAPVLIDEEGESL